MHIESMLICRANGKVYEKLLISGLQENSNLVIIKKDGDSSEADIPARLYQQVNVGPDSKTAVAVYPIMTIHVGSFDIAEYSPDSELISRARHIINFNSAKWSSRVNYRTHRAACNEIRLIDERELDYGEADIRTISAIGTDSHLLMRVEVSWPNCPKALDGEAVQLDCVNLRGETVLHDYVYMGSSVSDLSSSRSTLHVTHTLSVRIQWNQKKLFLYAWVKGHPETTVIRQVDQTEYEQLLNQSNSMLYRDAYSDPYYEEWLHKQQLSNFELDQQRTTAFKIKPLFSIVVPLYNTPLLFFDAMLSSVIAQTYGNWELLLVNASPDNPQLNNRIQDAAESDNRIRLLSLNSNGGISLNTNAGINIAKGDFVCFLDHDDYLEPNTLFEYAKALNQWDDIDLIYCDEDKVSPEGKYVNPFFKPDFSIDLLRNNNYICHFLTVRKSVLDMLPPNTPEFDGAQDYNLILHTVERARRVHHVPMVLYHWRISETSSAGDANEKSYANEAGLKALTEHLHRVGLDAKVQREKRPFTFKVIYDVPANRPMVSIIIPTKDHARLLKDCISSIVQLTTYSNYEIILVENNSTEPDTFECYRCLQDLYPSKIRVVSWSQEFNFSKLINFGAQHAKGDYLLLLNNDTRVITPDWMKIMLGIASRQEVGAVGVRLYYPDDTLQHAGVGFGDDGPAHYFTSLPRGKHGYFCLDDAQRNLSGVTAACMMTRKDVFFEHNGFNEDYAVAYNDVDYCLRLQENGYLITYTPEVELYHYESISRGFDEMGEERIRYIKELARLHFDWAPLFAKGDPYYTPNLRRNYPDFCYYHF